MTDVKLIIDTLKKVAALNENYTFAVESRDLTCSTELVLYVSHYNKSTSFVKHFLKALFKCIYIPIGSYSNDGIINNNTCASIYYTFNNVLKKDAEQYYKGFNIADEKLGTVISDQSYNIISSMINNNLKIVKNFIREFSMTSNVIRFINDIDEFTNSYLVKNDLIENCINDAFKQSQTYRYSIREKPKKKEPKQKKHAVSAFNMVRQFLDVAISKMDQNIVEKLCDKSYNKQFARIPYPILLEVDISKSYADQTWFNGKCRYAKKYIVINNKNYYITNHIFHKDVNNINKMICDLCNIEFVEQQID